MAEIYMTKGGNGAWFPDTEEDQELCKRFKVGTTVRFVATQPRNYEFHKKFFALVKFAYDQWSDTVNVNYKGQPVQPNMDTFRRDLIIMAGYSYMVVHVNGSVRVEAESISFAKMNQETFEKLYSSTINVVLNKILSGRGYTEEKLRELVDRTLEFA